MVMAQQDKFYVSLVNEIGLPELAEDPRFKGMKDAIIKTEKCFSRFFQSDSKPEQQPNGFICWTEKLPVAPVNSIPEALKGSSDRSIGTDR